MRFTVTQQNKKIKAKTPLLERVVGIEPTRPGRKHGILPLNYTRKFIFILYTIEKIFSSIKKLTPHLCMELSLEQVAGIEPA